MIVDKSINLIGENKNTTVINGEKKYLYTIIIFEDVNNVLISGFTITGRFIGWGTPQGSQGIDIRGDNNIIWGNKIIFNRYGIYLDDEANNNTINNNIIAHNSVRGIYDRSSNSDNTVTWNVIGGNGRDGLYSEKGRGIHKDGDGGIFHHNDFDLNWGYNAYTHFSDWGIWDDGSEGNFWDDWVRNPGYPDVYIIKGDYEQIDYYPSTNRYINYTIVIIETVIYEENPGVSIQFDSGVNRPTSAVSWLWDFGDGKTSDEKNPAHSYSKSGIYKINVTVTDDKGQSDMDKGIAYIGIPPEPPVIKGPTKCRPNSYVWYSFASNDSDSNHLHYYIDWGDGWDEYIDDPYPPGEEVIVYHWWKYEGNFTIKAMAIDETLRESDWGTLDVCIPRSRISIYSLFSWFLERFPLLERLLVLFK